MLSYYASNNALRADFGINVQESCRSRANQLNGGWSSSDHERAASSLNCLPTDLLVKEATLFQFNDMQGFWTRSAGRGLVHQQMTAFIFDLLWKPVSVQLISC